MGILQKIIGDKKEEIEFNLKHITTSDLTRKPTDSRIPKPFRKALVSDKLAIIAEVKKASPSKGLIREDFDPKSIASSYAKHNANCMSVLTESKYFLGSNDYLKEIRKLTDIPLLRKDFIVDKRQIRESFDLGADAILLIVSALEKLKIAEFMELARTFGLDCLVEVHSIEEMQIAVELKCDLIGVNNRNLSTFVTDINQSIELKKMMPDGVVSVSESGISTPEHCELLYENSFNAILVGETLMRKEDPGLAIDELMSKVR